MYLLCHIDDKHGMSLSEALNLVKSKRSVASPNSGFMLQLQKYEKCLRVMGVHDFLCLRKWTGAEVQEELHHDIRPTLQRLPFYCTSVAAVGAAIPEPTPEDLAAGTSSAKVMAKAESSKKRKALLSAVALSHVVKRTTSVMAQSSGSTTRPSLFSADYEEENDDDKDACVEIPLIKSDDDKDACVEIPLISPIRSPIRSADVIPTDMNQRGSASSAAEGPIIQDSRGKAVMTDVVATPSGVVGRSRPIAGRTSSFREVSGDATHRDFFPFSAGPYYATYPEGGIAGNCEFSREWDAPHQPTLTILTKEVFKDPSVCKTVVDQFPTPGEMVRIQALTDDELTDKMSVLHCLMMSHGGELLARYRGLLKSHHDYVESADSRLKSFEERCAALEGLESQVSDFQKRVVDLNDKLSASDAAFAKAKSKGEERKNKIKSLTKNLDQLNAEVARLSAALNQATVLEAEKDEEILRLKASSPELAEASLLVAQTKYSFLNKISDHAADPLSVILQLEAEKLARSEGVPLPQGTRVSPPVAKESTVTPISSSLDLPSNDAPSSSAAVLGQNEEWINDMGL
nr:dual specificity protein phosphatase 1-like [Tanacetum cinerariifolium]